MTAAGQAAPLTRAGLHPRLHLPALAEWLRLQVSLGVLPWGPDAIERLKVGDLVGLQLVGRTWPPTEASFRRGPPALINAQSPPPSTVVVFAEALHHYIGAAVPLPAGWAPTRVVLERVLLPLTTEADYMLRPRSARPRWLPTTTAKLPSMGKTTVYLFTEQIFSIKPTARLGAAR